MTIKSIYESTKTFLLIAVIAIAGYFTRDRWLPLLQHEQQANAKDHSVSDKPPDHAAPVQQVVVSEQAQINLGLKAKQLKTQTYWKTIDVPGIITDKPGQSDRNIIAPVTGVITKIFHCPCDTVKPGDALFQLKLLSETLLSTQSDLFKSMQEIELAQAQKKRLTAAAGAVTEARLIEIDNQILRQQSAIKAYRAELQTRGFSQQQIEGIAKGEFINEMTIYVPPLQLTNVEIKSDHQHHDSLTELQQSFEVQMLNVELGHQVQAGQTLCTLSNHQHLIVEGRAFRNETMLLEKSVAENWPVEIDFQEEKSDWNKLDQTFFISHLSNEIDLESRTFEFHTPLENQARLVHHQDHTQILWRFRPGQKVRMKVKVDKLENVFVLPAEAVAKEGVEAFIFSQNVNTFKKLPVRILTQDSKHVVFANDGLFPTGIFIAQSAAEQLNRMLKSGDNSGVPKGYHMHADGSLHKNGDPE